jgi:hypothetical protein
MTFLVAILPGGLPDPSMPLPTEVEVTEVVHQATVYRLHYVLSLAAGDLPLLLESRLGPEADIAIEVADGDATAILVKGPVSAHRIQLKHGVGGSTVDVLGGDYSLVMNRESKAKIWPGPTDSSAVQSVLAAQPGILLAPDVQSTSAQHTEDKHVLIQRETDLQFIRRLAQRNGYWFWFSYGAGAAGPVNAHFKAPPAADEPALELRLNVAESNIDAVEIDWDVERPAAVALSQLDLGTREAIDVTVTASGVRGLAANLLAAIAPSTRQSHLAVPADDSGDLNARGQGALLDSDLFVQVRASVKRSVLGKVVRAHSVVQLTGAGTRHSGKYLVWSVNHLIKDGEHVMHIGLVRNGWN